MNENRRLAIDILESIADKLGNEDLFNKNWQEIEDLITHKLDDELISEKNSIFIFWHISDILNRARERNIRISLIDARNMLQEIKDNHDACIGINWDVIDAYLDEYVQKISDFIEKNLT
jgi:hypothetical protein